MHGHSDDDNSIDGRDEQITVFELLVPVVRVAVDEKAEGILI